MNVLFLFADQMHAFAMRCMGNEDIHTPNLDRLAEEGVLFRNCYSNAPVCTPYRAMLFTGRYGSQTGVLGNTQRIPEGERTLADSLNDGGIHTSYVGKWHLGDKGNVGVLPELRGGFTDFIGYQCYNDFLDQLWFFDEAGTKHEYTGHRTEATTDIAIDRLGHIADRPFTMCVSYQNPHYPIQPSPEYEAMYAGRTIKRRPNCVDVEPHTPTQSPPSPRPPDATDPNWVKYGGNLDEYLRLYDAMVTQLDANVGRLLDELDRLGLRENTVVVFTSDHGDMQGSHGLVNKGLPWEESSHVPLIIRDPSGLSGHTTEELVSGIDFYPSILVWTGCSSEPSAEGNDITPLTRDESAVLRKPVFAEMKPWCMIRDGAYKLVIQKDGFTPSHLFDLESDPYEMDNLLDDPAHADTQRRLEARLEAWHAHVTAAAR